MTVRLRRMTLLLGWLVFLAVPASGQAIPPASGAQTPAAAPPRIVAGQDGFVIESASGDFRLQLGVLVHADGRFVTDDPDNAVTNTFLIRRARPSLRGRLFQRFEFFVNPDFGNGTVVLQDAYLDTRFSSAFRLRLGKTKTPFGMERLTSVSNIAFFERGYPTALVPNRDAGIQVLGDLAGARVTYQAGVLNGVVDGGSGDLDTNDGKDIAGRLLVRPFNGQTDHLLRGLGVAIAGSTGEQAGLVALPTFRTTLANRTFFSYVGATADGRRNRYSPQAFYYLKSFGGWAEYVHSSMPVSEGGLREEIAHDAWQIAGSYLLTGEAATDGAIRPAANFDFGNGHYGAIQIAARYHTLSVEDDALTLGFAAPGSSTEAEAWTIGVNWFWNPFIKYVFNFEHTTFDNGVDDARPSENALVFRTQLNF